MAGAVQGAVRSEDEKISQIEDDVSLLKGEVGSLRSGLENLGGKVSDLSGAVAESGRQQREMHSATLKEFRDFQHTWQKQKDDEHRASRIGLAQAFQIAGVIVLILSAAGTVFFFMTKAYIDGSTTQTLTELSRIANDNRETIRILDESDGRTKETVVRLDERQKAADTIRDLIVKHERELREATK